MNISKSTLLALFALSLSTVPAFTQSGARAHHESLTTHLGLGVHHPATSSSQRRSVPDPVALGLATAKVYHFSSVDFPGAAASLVFDTNISTSTTLGDTAFNSSSGFTLHGGLYQLFSVPGSTSNLLTGTNTAGEMVGVYVDFSGNTHGFLDNAGTFTTIDIAGGTTEPTDINDSGEIVGVFIDSSNVSHGFFTLDSGASFTIFDVPGATLTLAAGVNSAGVISGEWSDSVPKQHAFIFSGGVFTSIDFPLATSTNVIGINDSNEVAGFYGDAANVNHGFLYSAGNFTKIDVAGAAATQLTRIKNKGQITGLYTDSLGESHGLIAH